METLKVKWKRNNSSEPPCKDGNVRFTTIPLKALTVLSKV